MHLTLHTYNVLTLLATGIIAVFTTTLWWSTYKLWRAGERQLRVATKAAKAAARTAQALIDNQRPWVGLKHMDETQFVPHKQVGGIVIVKNSGRTPAIKVKLVGVDKIVLGQECLPIPSTERLSDREARVLMPNVEDRPPFTQALTPAQTTKLERGDFVYRIAIRIEYFGLFPAISATILISRYVSI